MKKEKMITCMNPVKIGSWQKVIEMWDETRKYHQTNL